MPVALSTGDSQNCLHISSSVPRRPKSLPLENPSSKHFRKTHLQNLHKNITEIGPRFAQGLQQRIFQAAKKYNKRWSSSFVMMFKNNIIRGAWVA